MLHPSAEPPVIAGKTGHKQNGLDVRLTLPDGQIYDYQCKLVKKFDLTDVNRAIKAYTASANKKYLVLSLVANPKCRDEVQKNQDWHLIDRNDINIIFRNNLSPEDQKKIIRNYFPGQDLYILGHSDASPWRNIDEFYQPFMGEKALLSHNFPIFGRDNEIKEIREALSDISGNPLIILSGAGGMGKSRLLKEALEIQRKYSPETLIYILSPSGALSASTLNDLGTNKKIIVIDDAHDQSDTHVIAEYATRNPQSKIILSTRPYGVNRIKREAITFNLSPRLIQLKELSKENLINLARSIQNHLSDNDKISNGVIDRIPEWAGFSPLMVMLIVKLHLDKSILPAALANDEECKNLILKKFIDVISGDLGSEQDASDGKSTLQAFSLLQPINISHKHNLNMLSIISGVHIDTTERIIKNYENSGVIIKRENYYRLSPDIIADFIIEEAGCVNRARLSEFSQNALNQCSGDLLINIITNLGRLDWRINHNTSEPQDLLKEYWYECLTIDSEFDPRLNAITSVAPFQPQQAFNFVHNMLMKDRNFSSFTEILKGASYQDDLIGKCYELLWEMRKLEDRDPNQHPSHPLNAINEIGGYKRNINYALELLNFSKSIANNKSNWNINASPIDLFRILLKTSAKFHKPVDSTSISISDKFINYQYVKNIREDIINILIDHLCCDNELISVIAAKGLSHALKPINEMLEPSAPTELIESIDAEIENTLQKIKIIITTNKLAMRSISYYFNSLHSISEYQHGATSNVSYEICQILLNDFECGIIIALTQGYGNLNFFRNATFNWDEFLNNLSNTTICTYADIELRIDFIVDQLKKIHHYTSNLNQSIPLIHRLINSDIDLSRKIINICAKNHDHIVNIYASFAVWKLLIDDKAYIDAHLHDLLEGNNCELRYKYINAHRVLSRDITIDNLSTLINYIHSNDSIDVSNASRVLACWAQTHPQIAKILIKNIDYSNSSLLNNELFQAINHVIQLNVNTNKWAYQYIISRINPLIDYSGYSVINFIADASFYYPTETARFLLKITHHSKSFLRFPTLFSADSFNFRFIETEMFHQVLDIIWCEFSKESTAEALYPISRLINQISIRNPGRLVDYLKEKINQNATKSEWEAIANILWMIGHDFVFAHHDFVDLILNYSKNINHDLCEKISNNLYSSTVNGTKWGTPGKPAERDLEILEKSKKCLSNTALLSAAYPLYQKLIKYSENEIKNTRT